MRISDWSSDVCSSDIHGGVFAQPDRQHGDVIGLWRTVGETMHFGNQSPAMLQRAMAGGRHGEQAFAAVCLVVVIEGFGDAVGVGQQAIAGCQPRSEEHTSELQSLMRISYAVFR